MEILRKLFKDPGGVPGISVLCLILVMLATLAECNANAQQGVIPGPEATVEDILSETGPINMQVVWDYIIDNWGEPNVMVDVILFEADRYPVDGVIHIQFVTQTQTMHTDVPLALYSSGGALTDNGSFQFIWFCLNDGGGDNPAGCILPRAEWVVAYDATSRAVLYWPERILR